MPGIPVVITDKFGIPVRQVTSGAPLMTVAANGRGVPIVLSATGMAFVVEGATPPADIWQTFDMTAGTSINWVGYIRPSEPNPTGSITREPNPAHTMLKLIFDPVTDEVIAEFLGDVEDDLEGFSLFVGGFEIELGYVTMLTSPVRTRAHYMTETDLFVSGATYEVEFKSAATGGIFTGVPSISGTRGGILTATNATFSGTDTLSGQWYLDGVATGDTDTSFSDSDTSKVVEYRNSLAISGETVSAYLEVEASAPIYFNDFSSTPAGKPLADTYFTSEPHNYSPVPNGPGVTGWMAVPGVGSTSNAESFKVGAGGGIYRSTVRTSTTVYPTGTNDHYVEYEIARPNPAIEERYLLKVAGAVEINQYSSFAVNIDMRVNSTGYDWIKIGDVDVAPTSAPAADGDKLGILVAGMGTARRVYIFLNGTALNPDGYDPTGLSGYLVGDRIGFGTDEDRTVTGEKIVHSVAVYSGLAPLVSVALEDGTTTVSRIKIDYRNATPSSTDTQYRVDVVDGPMVQGWTNIGATGVGSLYYDVPDDQAGKSLRVSLRNVGGTVRIAASSPVLVPFPPSKFAKGINNSGAGVNYRNLFSRFEIRFTHLSPWGGLSQTGRPNYTDSDSQFFDGSIANMGYDGVIQKYPDGFPANFIYICDGVFVETGIYEIYYPSAMTCALTNNVGGALADATILTPFSGGYGKIQITNNMPKLRFTFAGGTSGSLNLKPTGYLESDTNRSRLYAESSVIPFTTIGAIGERHLDTLIGNGDGVLRLTADQIWDGGAGVSGPWSPEMIAQKANAEGVREIWIPVSYLWRGVAFLKAFFMRLLTALDPDIKVRIEPPNETWNTAFRNVTQWALQAGVNAGLWNTNGDATPVASNYAWSGVDYNPDGSSLSMLRTYNLNDYVLFENIYGVGHVLLQAKKNIDTGTADYPTRSGSIIVESAAWLPIAQPSDCERAKMRYYAEWADFLWDIVDAVCVDLGINPRTKIIRQICWMQGAPPANIIDWNNLHERVDSYGFAPYHNPNLLRYPSSPLTSGEKALLATDIPGFINACYAHATVDLASKIAEFPAFKAAIDETWSSRDYAENAKETVTYEFGGHVEAKNDGAGPWNANMSTAFPMFRRDARYGTLTQTYTQAWKDVFHSPTYYFNSVGELPNDYNGQYGYWPLMENNNDITNVAYVGFGNVTDEV